MTDHDSTKTCTKCGVAQPRAQFNKHKSTHDGLTNYCKQCISAYNARYREQNKERIKATLAEWYQHNKEAQSARMKEWREANREYNSARKRQWEQANKEWRRKYDRERAREWRKNNPEAARAADARWRKNNPEAVREKEHRRRAQRAKTGGEVSPEILAQLFADQDSVCAYCEKPLQANYEVDHMVPLSRAGAHHWSNLAITCRTCNRRKHAKTVEEFFSV